MAGPGSPAHDSCRYLWTFLSDHFRELHVKKPGQWGCSTWSSVKEVYITTDRWEAKELRRAWFNDESKDKEIASCRWRNAIIHYLGRSKAIHQDPCIGTATILKKYLKLLLHTVAVSWQQAIKKRRHKGEEDRSRDKRRCCLFPLDSWVSVWSASLILVCHLRKKGRSKCLYEDLQFTPANAETIQAEFGEIPDLNAPKNAGLLYLVDTTRVEL